MLSINNEMNHFAKTHLFLSIATLGMAVALYGFVVWIKRCCGTSEKANTIAIEGLKKITTQDKISPILPDRVKVKSSSETSLNTEKSPLEKGIEQLEASLNAASSQKNVDPNDYGLMRHTVKQCKEMLALLKNMESPLSEDEKMKKIMSYTSRNGGEEGSFSADTSESACIKMRNIIETVLEAYKTAKENNDLNNFFLSVESGCIEGRMSDLSSYGSKIDGVSLQSVQDSDKYLDLFACSLSDILAFEIFPDAAAKTQIFKGKFNADTQGSLRFEGTIDTTGLREFLSKKLIEELIKNMRLRVETIPGRKAFLEYLELEKMYNPNTQPDWPVLLQTFINSNGFSKACAKSLEIANAGLFMA
jgi:hypothetical protein